MTDLNDLRRAGHSTTGTAWLTNPVRRGLLKMAGPHLLRILEAVGELNGRTLGLERRTDAIERHGQEAAARPQPGGALKEELVQLTRALDGLRKDQMAAGHRLGSLEDQTEQEQQAGAALRSELLALAGAVAALRQEQAAVAETLGGIGQEATERRHAGDAMQAELRLLAPAIETLRQEQLSLHRRVDGVAAKAEAARTGTEALAAQLLDPPSLGLATLPRNQPLAVRGTSLVLHDGPYGRFLLRQPDLISDHILGGGFWDAHLKPVIERAAAADRTAIDAGAYLGFHSVYIARYFRTVHAFEPQPEIYRMLCANLLLNGCHNVIAANAALYDGAGHMRLADRAEQEIPVPGHDGEVDYDRIGNAAALTFQPAEAGIPMAVPARTVDQLGLADLAFMKVDAQGSDLHVLRGARATIQRCRPAITAEYERELARIHGDTLDDYHRFFDELGYAVEVLDNRGDGKQIDLLATPR
jgi:FkbM family methyltransferase